MFCPATIQSSEDAFQYTVTFVTRPVLFLETYLVSSFFAVENLKGRYKGQVPTSPVRRKTPAKIKSTIASVPEITSVINSPKITSATSTLTTRSMFPIFFFIRTLTCDLNKAIPGSAQKKRHQ